MNWWSFMAGLIAPPVIGLLGLWMLGSIGEVQQFRRHDIGRGYVHEVEVQSIEDGRWGHMRHRHGWPKCVPWWFIRLAEPWRTRRCLARHGYREVGS